MFGGKNMKKQSLNSFADHAPKIEWIEEPESSCEKISQSASKTNYKI